jgi:hypothetical protein
MAADYASLSLRHKDAQVREAAVIQAALSRLWDDTIDPADLAGSFEVFREKAVPLISLGRLKSEGVAQGYYEGLLRGSGISPNVTVAPSLRTAGAIKSSLTSATDLNFLKYQIANGGDPQTLLASAKGKMLGSAKRQTINAGRERLLEIAKKDPNVRGWARQSDGAPCAFCAMLVGRGPVYGETTVTFRAHDRCGCTPRLVLYSDADGGMSPEARRYAALYEDGALEKVTPAFRKAVQAARLAGMSKKDYMAGLAKSATKTVTTKAAKVTSWLDDLPRLAAAETMKEAAQKVNPGYGITADFGHNCHYVVNAVELRSRGYNVMAAPTIQARGRTFQQIAFDWQDASGKVRPFTMLTSKRSVSAQVSEVVADWPVGARGYIAGAWKGRNAGGHIWSVEKTADGIRLLEGQTPNTFGAKAYFANLRPGSAGVLRVDDLVPRERLTVAVVEDTVERRSMLDSWRSSGITPLEAKKEEILRVEKILEANAEDITTYQALIDSGTLTLEEARYANYFVTHLMTEVGTLEKHLMVAKMVVAIA